MTVEPAFSQGPGATTNPLANARAAAQSGAASVRNAAIGDPSRGMFLSGKVQLENGSPPPQPVAIQRVCNGVPRVEAYTDSKGRFNLQVGQGPSLVQDASLGSVMDSGQVQYAETNNAGALLDSGRASSARLSGPGDISGCELRAALPGYRSDSVNLDGRRLFDHPDVGVIVLRHLSNVEGDTISVTTLEAPKDARKAYRKAQEQLRKDKLPEAQRNLEKATALFPRFAAAWCDLGRIHERNNQTAAARHCYKRAVEADGKFISPHLALALLSARGANWLELETETGRVIKLDPVDFPQAFFYNAVANYHLGRFDAAEASARKALQLDSGRQIPRTAGLLGEILFAKQDYAGAAEQIRAYLLLQPDSPDGPVLRRKLAEADRLAPGHPLEAAGPKK